MRLWVDDFRPAPAGWVWAKTVEEAQRLLKSGLVEQASLDHDMGACVLCVAVDAHIGDMATPETTFYNWCPHACDGTDLVTWMADTNTWPTEKPVVHSANPIGSRRMRALIEDYWTAPTEAPRVRHRDLMAMLERIEVSE